MARPWTAKVEVDLRQGHPCQADGPTLGVVEALNEVYNRRLRSRPHTQGKPMYCTQYPGTVLRCAVLQCHGCVLDCIALHCPPLCCAVPHLPPAAGPHSATMAPQDLQIHALPQQKLGKEIKKK